MKLSSRSEYGIRALLELAQRQGEGPIQSREIAERQRIPDAYLNQLLLTLRKAGIVRSVRGPSGGHLLGRSPERVTLSEVVSALEGLPAAYVSRVPVNNSTDDWAVGWVAQELDGAVREVLNRFTLATLLEQKRTQEAALNYQI